MQEVTSGKPAPVYKMCVAEYHPWCDGSALSGFAAWAHNVDRCGECGLPTEPPAYRRGSKSAKNLTPSEKDTAGLSMTETPSKPAAVISGGKAKLRETGFDIEDQPTDDDPLHFLVRPGPEHQAQGWSLGDWINSRSGVDNDDPATWHPLTKLLKDMLGT